MDIIEVVKKDKAYNKCKALVKNWEKEFKIKHSRVPSKLDIKEAPIKVKYAYKKYFQLKSAALENTLDLYDANESIICSPESTLAFDGIVDMPSPKSDVLMHSLPSGQELNELLSSSSNAGPSNVNLKKLSPLNDNFSKKLFQFSNVNKTLRNPRKSISSKSQPTTYNLEEKTLVNEMSKLQYIEKSTNVAMSLPVDQKKSCSDISSMNIMNVKENLNTNVVRKINEGWLERVSGLCIKTDHTPQITEKFGIKNVHMNTSKYNYRNQIQDDIVDDFVENSESETEDITNDKLKPALKKRKIIINNLQTVGIDTVDIKENSKLNNEKKSKKNKIKNVTTNKLDNEPPEFDQFISCEIEQDLLPRLTKESLLKTENKKLCQTKKIVEKNGAEKLEQKIKTGTLNDNFVKINIEKKVFVRGKKTINYSKYKKQQWKKKKTMVGGMEFPESGKIACFKCGEFGHMSRYCTAHKGDTLLPLNAVEDDIIPTLEEMDMKNTDNTNIDQLIEATVKVTNYKPSCIPETFLNLLSNATSSIENDNEIIKPIYNDLNAINTKELYDTLKLFGHESFRFGQEEAVKRILCGNSTLLLLSTGGGKSLCYQLPAYIYSKYYKCITLVISPLVSLMEDQILSMPDFLKAGCLHTNQSQTHRSKILQLIKDGHLNILLISPEALISGDGSNGFKGLFKSLPPIAFACIDEAHCVSQWSHNFRPSYLMICRVLQERLKVKCILGLTATASQSTVKSIINHIKIPDGFTGVISNPELPSNLILSVSQERDKDRSLLNFLSFEPINLYTSIIVYCIRRDECERVAAILRSSLQESNKPNMEKRSNKRKQMSFIAEAYHAGMSAAQRKKIQNNFMNGTLRIIVATVAFGMGINKSDIRCIIHYDMPNSFESYVQEVGRAGRDGQQAHCHVFVSINNDDKNELLKHIHSNSVDRNVIRKLLQKVFLPCNCSTFKNTLEPGTNKEKCKGHEVAISIDETVEDLDLAAENIATLLCYLELHPKKVIKVLNNTYTMCKVISYGGSEKLKQAASKCAPLAMAYTLKNEKYSRNKNCQEKNVLEFPIVDVAAEMGWESGITKYNLKNLEWKSDNGTYSRSELKVEFHTLGFRIRAPGDLTSTELDEMLDYLHETVISQEKAKLYQLEEINLAFREIGTTFQNIKFNNKMEFLKQQSDSLKNVIRNYFQRECLIPVNIDLQARPIDEDRVISDVRAIINSYRDCNFTGRSIARIFQGISSPNYPAIVWGRCKFWRTHMQDDFYGLVRIATQQIIAMKIK